MPSIKRPHGKRRVHEIWAELVFPPKMYKIRQSIRPLRNELIKKDSHFKRELIKIRKKLSSQEISVRQANKLYFEALDAAIKRRQKRHSLLQESLA